MSSFEKVYADASAGQRRVIDEFIGFDGLHPFERGSCMSCGVEFEIPPRNGGKLYCSTACRQVASVGRKVK